MGAQWTGRSGRGAKAQAPETAKQQGKLSHSRCAGTPALFPGLQVVSRQADSRQMLGEDNRREFVVLNSDFTSHTTCLQLDPRDW